MRICSLLPGATEVVAMLGRTRHLVGISHECDHPPEIKGKPVMIRATMEAGLSSPEIDNRVRATLQAGRPLYELDETMLVRVRPDLVIAQTLCDVCAITPSQLTRSLRVLSSPPRVLSLGPSTLDDVLADIGRIGEAIGRSLEAANLVSQLRARLEAVLLQVAHAEKHPRVACLEWLDPLFAAGHWVPEMVACAGGVDVLGKPGSPSKQIAWKQVREAKPDVLVIMPCGFPIARTKQEMGRLTTRAGWKKLPAVKNGAVFLVDGSSYFNRPGPRLIDGIEILAPCFHPSLKQTAGPDAVEQFKQSAPPARKRTVARR
jgi:iron complex transport system substrate-binding protein